MAGGGVKLLCRYTTHKQSERRSVMKTISVVRNSVVSVALLFLLSTVTCGNEKPWQFLAKLYTEAFGRIPDPTGWQGWGAQLTDVASMRTIGIAIYTDDEFLGDYPSPADNASRVLALFRGALNREPGDSASSYAYINELNAGRSWISVVTEVFNSNEFNTLATAILNSSTPYYGWGPNPVLTLPTSSEGWDPKTDSVLQDSLDVLGRNGGGPLYLAQRAVVRAYHSIWIPPNVTLATWGEPGPHQYARMARLVRSGIATFAQHRNGCGGEVTAGFTRPLVLMGNDGDIPCGILWGEGHYGSNHSKLKSIWVDGQRSQLVAQFGDGAFSDVEARINSNNIKVMTDGTSEVSNCRFSDPLGAHDIQVTYSGIAHEGIKDILSNLVTHYACNHYHHQYPGHSDFIMLRDDGIDTSDKNAHIYYNQLVDVTDVVIAVLPAYPESGTENPQNSQVEWNQILNAGNSAYSGIMVDPLCPTEWQRSSSSFQGARVANNLIWTSPSAHLDIALGIGDRTYFLPLLAYDGVGSTFSNNTSGSQSVTCNVGILLNGMTQVTVSNNSINTSLFPSVNLPEYSMMMNSDPAHASGTGLAGFKPFGDDTLHETDHAPVYISEPSVISTPPAPGQITYGKWTALPIGETPVNPKYFIWTFMQPGRSPIVQTERSDFTVPLEYQGIGGSELCMVQCSVAAMPATFPAAPTRAKKYVTKYFGGLPKTVSTQKNLPSSFALYQNYPNPFNPTTTIKYDLPIDTRVSLQVHDLLGREVVTLVNGPVAAGYHEAVLNSNSLASGVYFYRLEAGNYAAIKKLVLLK
jgi:hypothetical protein